MTTHFQIPKYLIRMRSLTLCLKSTANRQCSTLEKVTCKNCLRIHKEAKQHANHPLHAYLYPTEKTLRTSRTEDVVEYCQGQGYLPREVLRVLYLDVKNQLLEDEILNIGTADHSYVDTKALFSTAFELQAKSLILIHNHPTGICTPSPDDYKITKKIVAMCELFDIELLEHLVISRTDWRRV